MYTREQIKIAYKQLPDEIRQVLSSEEFSSAIQQIVVPYTLSETQTNNLIRLITYTILDLEKKENLSQNIQKEISLDVNTSSKLAGEIITQAIDNLPKINEMIEKNIDIFENGLDEQKNTFGGQNETDKDTAKKIRQQLKGQKSVTDILK